MSCQEKARLAEDYRAATAAFAEAVRDFQHRMESTSTEYDLLRRISDEVWGKSEKRGWPLNSTWRRTTADVIRGTSMGAQK